MDKIHDRGYKFFPANEVTMKWSKNKHMSHPGECVKFASNLLDKEVFEKELFQRGEENLAWEVINTVIYLYRLTAGDIEAREAYKAKQVPGRMYFALGGTQIEFGQCEWEVKGDLLPLFQLIFQSDWIQFKILKTERIAFICVLPIHELTQLDKHVSFRLIWYK